MNLSELILNKNQIAPFIITILLTWVLYKYLNREYNIRKEFSMSFPIIVCIIYVIFLIIYRIITTNTNFSKPLVNYIIQKKNFKEEPYQINYINPYITNLDKVDFNMKKNTNKKYIKRILNELLIRKYVQFENVLAYNKNPWQIIKLTEMNTNKYMTENDGEIDINDNKYCKNYLNHIFETEISTNVNNPVNLLLNNASKVYEENGEKQCLILYRKYIIQFEKKLYFIFEKKNKKDSKYYLNECISQIVINSNSDYYSIIDTRDLHYDRQYVLFENFPISGDKTKKQWQRPKPIGNISDGYKSKTCIDVRTGVALNKLSDGTIPSSSNGFFYNNTNNGVTLNNVGSITTTGTFIPTQNGRVCTTNPITTIDDTPDDLLKVYKSFSDTPINYYWQNDHIYNPIKQNSDEYARNIVHRWKNIYVIDIYFVYNDMVILDENRNLLNTMDKKTTDADNTADFSLNKYYNKRDWIIKRYYNLIRNQFNNRLKEDNLNVYLNDIINDVSTIKFRNILGKNKFNIKNINVSVYINKKNINNNNYTNEIILYESGDKKTQIKINFEEYIKKYIQNKDVEPGELVIIRDKKADTNNNLQEDKTKINYVSFNFLNIKKSEETKKGTGIIEYKKKMNYLADEILKKYFKPQMESISKIKYNLETLEIIQFDNLFRYDKGRKRLVLNNKIITPNNIGENFRNIDDLRYAYKDFLEKELKYEANLDELIKKNDNTDYLNVSNIKLLEIFNKNMFNNKSKVIAIIDKISNTDNTNREFTYAQEDINDDGKIDAKQKSDSKYNNSVVNGLNRTLTKLHISQKPNGYKRRTYVPLFVKFNTTTTINSFSINSNNTYIVHKTQRNPTLKPEAFYLEEFLLEPDISNNKTKIIPPQSGEVVMGSLKLYDCTKSFRKEKIGVANVIKIRDKKTFEISFDNVPLEFKKLKQEKTESDNIYIDEPIFVMLNVTKINTVNNISKNVYENQLYRVKDVRSTTLNTSASITVISNYDLILDSQDEEVNYIYKDILVSQFVSNENYIENVYFKEVRKESDDPTSSISPISYEIALNKQIINIEPPITRAQITASDDNYKKYMKEIIKYIYQNEAKKIHYEIPDDIGIYKDTTAAVYSYKYKNELYISYDKRNNPINNFKNTHLDYLCKKRYNGDNYFLNINALYNLDSYSKYKSYFTNMFKNIIGLHDEINYECNEYFKSGRMIDRLKIPISFNKYVTFSTNYMLYYKDQQLFDDIDPSYIGKHIVINNNVLDNNLLNINNSNRNNSNIYKTFIKDIIYTHNIGAQGFEYDDAKKICERIYTVYDKKCDNTVPTYKKQDKEYNIEFYRNNKKRDECFDTVYNTEKELNNEEFIAKIKGFDPTTEMNDIEKYSTHDFHIDPILNHSYYELNAATNSATAMSANTGSDYEKYTWLRQMMKNKGDIIVTNSNNSYYKIEQPTKDKKNVTIKEAPIGIIANVNEAAKSGVYSKIGAIKAIPHYGIPNPATDNLPKTTKYLFRFALDYDGYRITNIGTTTDTNLTPQAGVGRVDITKLDSSFYQIAGNINILREFKEKWLKEKINKFSDIIIYKNIQGNTTTYYLYKISIEPRTLPIPDLDPDPFTLKIKLTPIIKSNKEGKKEVLSIKTLPGWNNSVKGDYRFYKGEYKLDEIEQKLKETKWKTDDDDAIKEYVAQMKALEKIGNIQVKPHRLAQLNEIKTAAYYNADWDNIAWINDANALLHNKSNLIKIKDKKVLWFDKDDPNAKNKGVVCFGRKLDQNKLAQNRQNELFNFQMEKIEQNIKDLQKYENVSKFNKEVYSRWNL